MPVAFPGRTGHIHRLHAEAVFTAPVGYIGYEDTAQTFGVLTAHAGSDQAEFYVFRDPAPSTDDNGCAGDPNLIGALTVDSISSAFAADSGSRS